MLAERLEKGMASAVCGNGESKSTNVRGPSLVGSLCMLCRYKDFCSLLAALVYPVQNIFVFTIHYSNSFVFIAELGGQAVVLGHLSLSMCLLLLACPAGGGDGAKSYDKRSVIFFPIFVP